MTHGADPWRQALSTATAIAPLVAVMASCVAIIVPIWKGFGNGAWSFFKKIGHCLNPMYAITRKVDLHSAKVEQQSADIAAVRKLIEPNGGSSISDLLNKLLDRQDIQTAQVTALLESETALRWGSTPDGRQIWATGALVALTERRAEDLLGWGWINILDDLDRMALLDAWKEAQERGHTFDRRCHFVSRTGKRYSGRLIARPINQSDPKSLWIGEAIEIEAVQAIKPMLAQRDG